MNRISTMCALMPVFARALRIAWPAALLMIAACAHAPADLRTEEPASNRSEQAVAGVDPEVLSALDNISLARQLVRYARQQDAPEALAVAAGVLSQTPFAVTDDEAWKRRTEGAIPHTVPEGDAIPLAPAALLQEARERARGDAALLEWIEQKARRIGDRSRGALVSMAQEGYVLADAADYYEVVFEEGEPAIVDVDGAPDAELEVSVYDENARLIASDAFSPDGYRIVWTPAWRGPFTIVVKNAGGDPTGYSVAVN